MSLLHVHETAISQQELSDKPLKKNAIGIDLGTTHSLVAFAAHGEVTVIPDAHGKTLLPSAVYYGPTHVFVGDEALQYLATDPQNTIYSFKRFMGKGWEEACDDKLKYDFIEEPGLVRIQTQQGPISPVEMSAEILRTLKKHAVDYLQTDIEHAVISVPAYFNEAQRQATKKAAELAGLKVLRLLSEPTAAAIAYERQQEEETIAIYDLGGGTFDISLLQLRRGIFQVLATGGNTRLGGDDIDQALLHTILSRSQCSIDTLTPSESIQLKRYIRDLKESLSAQEASHYQFHIHTHNATTPLLIEGTITRHELAEIARPFIEQTITYMQQTLDAAALSQDDVHSIIMVGGSTRLHSITPLLDQYFPGKVLHHLDPDKTVAIGAALQADLLIGNRRHSHAHHPDHAWLLLDVLPLSLGIETYGGIVEPIIPRNTPIPAMKTQYFTTFQDGQTGIRIHVVQGERDMAADCHSLAQFELSGIPPLKAGLAKVAISFQIDADGLLSVSAREENTGIYTEIMTMPSYGLTVADIQKILKDSYQHAEADMQKRQLEREKVAAQQLIHHLRNALQEDADLLTPEEVHSLQQQINHVSQCIGQAEYDTLHASVISLNAASSAFSIARMNRALSQTLVGRRISESSLDKE